MNIVSAEFIISNTNYKECPAASLPEFAFIGRSNVGKSSLINMLVNRKNLARISSSPGKTQTINHFLINNKWYLVDLPGYGFAKAPKNIRAQWETMIYNYLNFRKNLVSIFVLIDSRIKPQKSDLNFIDRLGKNQIPFAIVFTKTDKQTKSKTANNIEAFCNELLKSWETLPLYFISSAEKGTGKGELLNYIDETMKTFKN